MASALLFPHESYFSQSHSYCGDMKAETREACGSFDVPLEAFVISWMGCQCTLREILAGWLLLLLFSIPNVFDFEIMAVIVVQ